CALPICLQALREALDTGTMRQVRRMISALKPPEIAHLLESLPPPQREILWELVDPADDGDVLVELSEDVRGSLLRDMDREQIVAVAAGLDVDDMADLLAELPETINREVLRSLDASHRLRLETVLRYDEDSAGGLMNVDTLTVRGDVTIEVVLRYLRMRRVIPRGTDAIFVVDRNNRYVGSLYITRVLTADPEQRVSEIMDTEAPAINAVTPANEVV